MQTQYRTYCTVTQDGQEIFRSGWTFYPEKPKFIESHWEVLPNSTRDNYLYVDLPRINPGETVTCKMKRVTIDVKAKEEKLKEILGLLKEYGFHTFQATDQYITSGTLENDKFQTEEEWDVEVTSHCDKIELP